jgi:outer membrane protein TolC
VPDLTAAVTAAQQDRPEIRSAAAQLRATGHLVSAARAEKRPLVAGVATVGKLNPQPLFDSRDQPYAVGIAVSIPVFTGGLLESQVEQARRTASIAQGQLDELLNSVRQQATSAVSNLTAANETVQVAEVQLVQASDALKLALGRYQAQLGTIVELSQAQVAYATAQNDLVRAQYDRELARAALAYATGRGYVPAGAK